MNQKPNYGNWVPEKMLALCYAAAATFGIAACVTGSVLHLVIPTWILGILAAICLVYGIYMHICHELFAFGKGNMMAKVHQHLVDHLEWDGEGCHALFEYVLCGVAQTGVDFARLLQTEPVQQHHNEEYPDGLRQLLRCGQLQNIS